MKRTRAVPVIRTIMVTTDFSARANRAIRYAAALAGPGAKVVVLNVQHPRALPRGEYENAQWSDVTWRLHRRYLARCRARLGVLARSAGARGEPVLVTAENVAPAICAAAAAHRVDVLCMASHGYTGIKAGLLGSTAQAVLAHSPVPLLLIRDRP